MRKVTKKKMISIETAGPLRIKGGIRGPIETPYQEEVSVIARMVMSGYKVYEHLKNGSVVKLDIHNYNKENGSNDLKTSYEPVADAKQVAPEKPKSATKRDAGVSDGISLNPLLDTYSSKK